MKYLFLRLLLGMLVLTSQQLAADVPSAYRPIVIAPPFSLTARVFDLSAALDKARREQKPLFIYLGAKDCPPCIEYEEFLGKHAAVLSEKFSSSVIVVNLTTRLAGKPLMFKTTDKSYTFEEFKQLVGDRRRHLTYPYYWLVSPELKQVKPMPQMLDDYLNVDGHLALLDLKRN